MVSHLLWEQVIAGVRIPPLRLKEVEMRKELESDKFKNLGCSWYYEQAQKHREFSSDVSQTEEKGSAEEQ